MQFNEMETTERKKKHETMAIKCAESSTMRSRYRE